MKIILFFLFIGYSFFALGQVPEPTLLSLKVIGGNGGDQVHSQVTSTTDGGFIISLGSTSSTGPIDSLCNVTYDRTIFQKYNADASLLEWSKCYYANTNDSGFINIFPVPDGGYILGGIGNGVTSKFLIHKENPAGLVLWSKSYGDGSEVLVRGMTSTDDGGFVMFAQIYYPSIDFPIHYGGFGNLNLAVIKVDSNGNKIWCKTVGGSGPQSASCVISARGGGCYIVGSTASNDFDCTGNHGGSDIYLARLDGNGNILWHHDLGGSGGDGGAFGYPDGNGGIIIAGYTGSNDGDVSHHIFGNNFWVLDVDSGNHILWDNCYGGGGVEFPISVCKATDGTIWVAGSSRDKSGQVDTNYGGSEDAWFVHVDNVGNFINAKVLGSSGQDMGLMVYPLSNGNVIAGGYYENGDGAFPNISWGPADAFITIFAPWSVGIHNVANDINAIKIFPNPANKFVSIQLDNQTGQSYEVTITNQFGQPVLHNFIDGNSRYVNIATIDWNAGLYFVHTIVNGDYSCVQKLIVY